LQQQNRVTWNDKEQEIGFQSEALASHHFQRKRMLRRSADHTVGEHHCPNTVSMEMRYCCRDPRHQAIAIHHYPPTLPCSG